MSATDAFETSLLGLIFTNVAAANVGDGGGLLPSATAGVFYVSLHSTLLTDANSTSQTALEAAYPSYTRQTIARTTAGFTVTGNTVTNDNIITFPTSTGSPSETEQSFGLGSAASAAAGNLFFYGGLTSGLPVTTSGIAPEFAVNALTVTLN